MVNRVFDGVDIALAFEPGRLIAGNAGILLSRVIRIQERPDRQFLVLDAGDERSHPPGHVRRVPRYPANR